MVDFRIEWHQEPLKCEIKLQNRGDVRDTILRFACFLCPYEREGDIVPTMTKLRQHMHMRHHFAPVNTTRIKWHHTHAGNRFVNKPGKGVQRRWTCQACPVYFKTKKELMEHFVPSHVPEDYKMPLSELDTVDTPPSSSSRSETEIDTPVSSLSLSSQNHAQSRTTDSNEDDDDVFQPPLPLPTARPLRSSPRKDKGKGKLQEAPMQLPFSTARSKLAKEANEGHRSSSGRNLASTTTNSSIVSSGSSSPSTSNSNSSGITSSTTVGNTEDESDGNSTARSTRLSYTSIGVDTGSQGVSDVKTQDRDGVALWPVFTNIHTMKRNASLASGETDKEEDEVTVKDSISSSPYEAEPTSHDESDDDDIPLAYRNNSYNRTGRVGRKRKDTGNDEVVATIKRKRLVRGDKRRSVNEG